MPPTRSCYGTVAEWFITRREMPKICSDNRCLKLTDCFTESLNRKSDRFKEDFRDKHGEEPENGYSYKTSTPKYRVQQK